jgi:DNA-binding MarR family transcriptional regulator
LTIFLATTIIPSMARTLQAELRQTKPFPSLEEEVFLEIQRTAQVAGRWVVEALRPSGLTPPQFNVLRILRGARPDALSSGGIAERMVNHDSDLTRLLDRLEVAGLVEKSRDSEDRRIVNVRITPAGLRLVESASRAVQLRIRTELGPLGSRRLGVLADLLELARGATGGP